MAKPAKGKRFSKIIKTVGGRTRKVSYGQAGKAKDGGILLLKEYTSIILVFMIAQ